MNIIDYAQSLTDGILFGAIYALIGIGFTLIFGVMDRHNIAFAGSAFAGAYVSYALTIYLPLPAILVFLIAALSSGMIGYITYFCCFKFVPKEYLFASLLASIGALMVIEEIIIHSTNGLPQTYISVFPYAYFEIGEFFGLRGDLIFIFGLALLVTVILVYVLYKTKFGIATRAVAQKPVAAQLCGISVEKTNSLVFVIAGFIGGLAGAMTSASIGLLSPMLMLPFTVKGLIVTVIGGLGSIPGAIIAGLMLGGFENVFMALRGVTERDMYVMLLLFVFLIFRPQGLFSNSVNRD